MALGEKHILLFISALRKGGAERVMVTLAEALKKQGIRVTLVTQYLCQNEYELSEDIPRIISEPSEEELGSNRLKNFFARYRKLRRIWKEQNPDCILSFMGKNNFMAISAALFTKIPVIVSVRGEPKSEYYTRVMRFLAKTLFALAAGVVVQTKEAMNFFPSYIRKRAIILKNPLNPAFVRKRFEGKRNGNIVSVGRVNENKNHEMLIRAFAQIADEFPQTSLIIYGDGEKREPLQRLVEELKLSKRIFLPGVVKDVATEIYQSSVFAFTSFHEGMPNALIEAMCLGIPSIATDCPCGGPREMINNGVNGFLIPVGDVEALADKLRIILSDEEKANQIGECAAQLLDVYRAEKVTAEWAEYLVSKMRQ